MARRGKAKAALELTIAVEDDRLRSEVIKRFFAIEKEIDAYLGVLRSLEKRMAALEQPELPLPSS